MRETRPSGSGGGVVQPCPYLIHSASRETGTQFYLEKLVDDAKAQKGDNVGGEADDEVEGPKHDFELNASVAHPAELIRNGLESEVDGGDLGADKKSEEEFAEIKEQKD